MAPLADHLRQPRILVVDDSPLNRFAFASVLEADGYRVVQASSGAEALALSQQEDVSVILLDVRMPDMNGYETATRLRQQEATMFTPIIFVSAVDQSQFHVSRGYLSGATDYIFSPVAPEFLRFKIGAFVHLRLRNEHLRDQILQLNRVIDELQRQIERSHLEEQAVRAEVLGLRRVVEELQRELSGAVFS